MKEAASPLPVHQLEGLGSAPVTLECLVSHDAAAMMRRQNSEHRSQNVQDVRTSTNIRPWVRLQIDRSQRKQSFIKNK